jgi:hypothetical protein
MSASWEMSGPRALPSISERIKNGCSWEVESQPVVYGGEGLVNIQRDGRQLMRRHGFLFRASD